MSPRAYVPGRCSSVWSVALLFNPVALGLLGLTVDGQRSEPCGKESVAAWIADQFRERCTSSWIKNNVTDLRVQLDEKLFGQHLAAEIILNTINGHLDNPDPPKALSLSFHGWTGIGKTYTSDMIAKSLYVQGMKSKFVKRFFGQDFSHISQVEEYKKHVKEAINECVSQCCQCLFIFDEVEKMQPGIFDSFKYYFDYYPEVHGTDYRKCIFLFISNIGSKKLADMMASHRKQGRVRELLETREVEQYLKDTVYDTDGGLKHSDLVKQDLLGTFVPFLPLEKEHIKQCIRAMGRHRARSNKKVEMVADSVSYLPEDLGIFATTGCTSVLQKLYQHDDEL